MRKWVLCLLVSLLPLGVCRAQFGVIGGLTSSRPDLTSAVEDAWNINLYHAGVTQKIPLVMGFAIQPALIYTVKGSCLGTLQSLQDFRADMRTGYLELPVQLQWGPDLGKFRPYVFAEPFLGYALSNSVRVDKSREKTWDNLRSRFEYGAGSGFGVELLGHIQLSVRYFWNLGYVYTDTITIENVTSTIAKNRCNGITLSLAVLL